VWDEDKKRHLCQLVLGAATEEGRTYFKHALAIGAGCCSPLNSWRREPLQDRTKWKEEEPGG